MGEVKRTGPPQGKPAVSREAKPWPNLRTLSEWTRKEVRQIAIAYEGGQSTRELANRHKTSKWTIAALVRKAGGSVRKPGKPRQFFVDEAFFDVIDTEEKAYWLGFISADGAIADDAVRVTLASKDAFHLKKLRKSLRSEHRIYQYKNHGYKKDGSCARFGVKSRRLVAALGKHGVGQRKSHTLKPPKLRRHLMRHYWRGMFDGDGSISSVPGSSCLIGLVGSQATIKGFADFVKRECGFDPSTRPHKSIYECRTCGRGRSALVLRVLYGSSTIYLTRKHKIACAVIREGVEPILRSMRPIRRLYEHDGKRLSPMQIATLSGLKHGTVKWRLDRGWSVDRIIQSPVDVTYDYEGKKITIADMATMSGFRHATIWQRLRRGWSVERAISVPTSEYHRRKASA